MATPPVEVLIDEIVVDSRLRMTRARIEQAVVEEVARMLTHTDSSSLVVDADGAIVIDAITLVASNAMSPARLGEAVAQALSGPLQDPEHSARTLTPTLHHGDPR